MPGSSLIPEGSGLLAALVAALTAICFGLMDMLKTWIGKRRPAQAAKLEPHIEEAITTNLELANRNLEVSQKLLEQHARTDEDGAPTWHIKPKLYRDVEDTLDLVKNRVLPLLKKGRE